MNQRRISGALRLPAILCGCAWLMIAGSATASDYSAPRRAVVQLPVFREVVDATANPQSGKHRIFEVVLPGFEAQGVFKSIAMKNGKLSMEPADGEQLFFRPSDVPVTSRVYLVRTGAIAAELLAKP
jgi:hypothetical protein